MHTKSKLWFFVFWACLVAIANISGSAEASEFQADVIMTGGMESDDGKVWVKGQKSRQEIGSAAEKMIIIMDLDQGFHWTLMPDVKMYMKNRIQAKGKGFGPENFVGTQPGKMGAEITKIGTEMVKGYKCDKYLFTFKNKQMGTMTQWFSEKLGYPIKTVNKIDKLGEITTELQNIQKTYIQDDLFIVPSGYQEMPITQMPKMPGKIQ